jgi:hypothetical protein
MKRRMNTQCYGIIRYLPRPGGQPQEDPCHFDGWYQIESWATSIYAGWCKDYPDWIVSIVTAERIKFNELADHEVWEQRKGARR